MLSRTFILRTDENAQALWAFLKANWKALAGLGTPLSVTVQEYKAKRSVEQNKLLWKLLGEVAGQAWVGGRQYSADAWHEQFKRQFIGVEELPNGDKVGISTTTLDVAEFSQYIEKISAYAASELGLEIMI